mgnify:CR=1 FL=1
MQIPGGRNMTFTWTAQKADKTEISGIYTEKNEVFSHTSGCIAWKIWEGIHGVSRRLCDLEKDRLDLHLYALREFGVCIEEKKEFLEAECRKLKGCEIFFAGSSVGATEQAVLTAASAEGKTRIHNCAKEPENYLALQIPEKNGNKDPGRRNRKNPG